MSRQNIFDGDSCFAAFALATYKRLMSRQWVTYADVMAESMMKKTVKELPNSVSYCRNYGELKKAFPAVCRAIKEKEGNSCIEEEGNNRNKRFRYIGNNKDPLGEMLNAKMVKDLKDYWLFCQDSAGFFPISWLEYFFKGSQDLLDIQSKKQKGEQILSASIDRMLNNIELLPFLYEAIKNHLVLSINYLPFNMELMSLQFHPHYLKEYNGRWFLLGHAEGEEPEFGFNIALDRIVERPREVYDCKWIPAPKGYYLSYFKDIVGVTHPQKQSMVEEIRIRGHNRYIFKLMETKPIHPSQTIIIPYGKHDDGEYGEFTVQLEVNNEFIGRILQMGHGLEIVAPKHVRNLFKSRVKRLSDLYEDNTKSFTF